jgi:polyhydroxyalkanoate synthesis regulator phasin
MKVKNMLRLLSLGTNIYLIAQDKELMDKLTAMAKAGKEKYDEIFHAGEDDEEEADLLAHMAQVAQEAKEKLSQEMESIAHKTYEKLRIAHADELAALKSEVERLRAEIAAIRTGTVS